MVCDDSSFSFIITLLEDVSTSFCFASAAFSCSKDSTVLPPNLSDSTRARAPSALIGKAESKVGCVAIVDQYIARICILSMFYRLRNTTIDPNALSTKPVSAIIGTVMYPKRKVYVLEQDTPDASHGTSESSTGAKNVA